MLDLIATRRRRALNAWLGALLAGCVMSGMTGCGSDDDGSARVPIMRGANVASPTLEGPATGGSGAPFVAATVFDLAQVGYSQAEYFISGTATSYVNTGALGRDGLWNTSPAATADFKTRILVYRPINRGDFSGTVFIEWLNVSGGLDAAPDWIAAHTELTRAGHAWVGVSAQKVGVEGGSSIVGLTPMPLKEVDPLRYGSLTHPGDSFSYDIFSQTAQAIRRPAAIDVLDGLDVEAVIAIGESQSAFRMVTYINAIHPRDDIYDGFLVHSRGGNGVLPAALSERPQQPVGVPGDVLIRDDLNAPVLTFQTETDLTLLGSALARQEDTDGFRLWEVAGTAHADTYTVAVGSMDLGDSPEAAKILVTANPIPQISCGLPINSGPQHFVLKAAIAALNRWVREGTPPPAAPRIETNDNRIVRDEHGNALGGIRTPHVDVPIATLSGEGQGGSVLCILFGTTTLFDAQKLAILYPDQAAYLNAFSASTDAAVAAGFILPPDAELLKAAAAATNVGGGL
jgi:hypothetical protein